MHHRPVSSDKFKQGGDGQMVPRATTLSIQEQALETKTKQENKREERGGDERGRA